MHFTFKTCPCCSSPNSTSCPRSWDQPPNLRSKKVVVITRPYCSPDPSGPKYEQYCQQKLMQHVLFRRQEELLGEHGTYAAAYASFLQSGSIPSSLEDDIHRLEQCPPTPEDNSEVCTFSNLFLGICITLNCFLYRVIRRKCRTISQHELWRSG